jgi:hypothetical protein
LIKTITTSRDDSSFDLVIDEVLCFFESEASKNKLSENYIKEELFLNSSDAITTVKEEDKIILFSTLFHRKIFKNSVRCLNRYFKPPQKRNTSSLGRTIDWRQSTAMMLEQQENIARNYDYDIIFFSRELKNREVKDEDSYKKTSCNLIRQNYKPFDRYLLSPRVHLTCDGKSIRNCWQQIIYKKLRDNATLNIESISLKEYREKFVI